MKITTKISFTCFFLFALMCATMGIRYLIADEIMSHHIQAIGVSGWSEVVPGFQVMLLMLMKGAGLGYLTTSLGICFLLFLPFLKGEAWSRWGLLAIAMTQLIGRLINVLIIKSNTASAPPVGLLAVAILLVITGFLFSFQMERRDNKVKTTGGKSKYHKIVLACYLVVVAMSAITGYIYSSADQIMSYHVAAMGVSSWEDIGTGYQFILTTYMRGAGLGFITLAVAVCIILFIPFRKGDLWARWGLLVVSVTHIMVMLWIVMRVRLDTPGVPPMMPLLIAMGLTITGFFMSSGMKSKRVVNHR